MMYLENDYLYLEAPTYKRFLCPDCDGDPSGIHYREWVTCRECGGEGCIGIRQCHTCHTEGRILMERHGCKTCEGHGMIVEHVADRHDPFLGYGAVMTPEEVAHWQQSVIDLFIGYCDAGKPAKGEPGSPQEGTVVFHQIGELWKGSEAKTLKACMKRVSEKRLPYGPFCYFENEAGHLCLQIFPPRGKHR